jgi:hypothetical protein
MFLGKWSQGHTAELADVTRKTIKRLNVWGTFVSYFRVSYFHETRSSTLITARIIIHNAQCVRLVPHRIHFNPFRLTFMEFILKKH